MNVPQALIQTKQVKLVKSYLNEGLGAYDRSRSFYSTKRSPGISGVMSVLYHMVGIFVFGGTHGLKGTQFPMVWVVAGGND